MKREGVLVSECGKVRKRFDIRFFCYDTPPKSFILILKHHTSYNGCHKCTQIHKRILNRSDLRADENFKARINVNYHNDKLFGKELNLEKIGVQMVSQFVVDPMHVIDLGVEKKLSS